jgi:hypothetical protein
MRSEKKRQYKGDGFQEYTRQDMTASVFWSETTSGVLESRKMRPVHIFPRWRFEDLEIKD